MLMYKFILLLATAVALQAQLVVSSGSISAHTEVFGDSDITPVSTTIQSHLKMDESIESIHGGVLIQTLSLQSTKKDRDKNMYELLNAVTYPTITFNIKKVYKVDNAYEVVGSLILNGVVKDITTKAQITQEKGHVFMKGDFSILLSQFNMEPPTLLFLTVRDQIDIAYNLDLIKE